MKKYLSALLVLLTLGCDDPAGDGGSETADSGSKKNRDAAQDSSSASGEDSTGETEADASTTPAKDAAVKPTDPVGDKDAGTIVPSVGEDADVPLNDAGVLAGSGSCCSEHDSAGCGNADLMVCVCEKDPSCCTKDWGRRCVLIVEQKYCQVGVRDCVCGTETGQQGVTACCESGSEWSSFCDSVAKVKCEAVAGCF